MVCVTNVKMKYLSLAVNLSSKECIQVVLSAHQPAPICTTALPHSQPIRDNNDDDDRIVLYYTIDNPLIKFSCWSFHQGEGVQLEVGFVALISRKIHEMSRSDPMRQEHLNLRRYKNLIREWRRILF